MTSAKGVVLVDFFLCVATFCLVGIVLALWLIVNWLEDTEGGGRRIVLIVKEMLAAAWSIDRELSVNADALKNQKEKMGMTVLCARCGLAVPIKFPVHTRNPERLATRRAAVMDFLHWLETNLGETNLYVIIPAGPGNGDWETERHRLLTQDEQSRVVNAWQSNQVAAVEDEP